MAKLVINKADLPPLDANEGAYFVRYRLTTDDRNKFSVWSTIYTLEVTDDYADVAGAVNVAGGIISVAWGTVAGFSDYDVWVRWDSGSWEFHSRIAGSFANIPVPVGPTTVSIRVYLPTYPTGTVQYAPYLIFESLSNAL